MQDTTPLEGRRRRLLFRATHRGTRENDILIGNFVATRLAAFSPDEITTLETIIELPDTWLADWLTGRTAIPAEHDTPLLRAMRDARGQPPALQQTDGQQPALPQAGGQPPAVQQASEQPPALPQTDGQPPPPHQAPTA